ncbi:DUF1266 domain-containing protein [Spirillospora sp. CA-294931]|uniref:DUF1266 domain-containing protein n=1 Tax=Spirillospora sp. CA-294931 TaxID=3240042 RepID=UPI003D8C83F9
MTPGLPAEYRFPVPLTTHQLWMVSLCAPVNRGSDTSRTTLYPYKITDDDRAREWLADSWGVVSADEVYDALEGLAESGYRAQVERQFGVSPLAWDVALYVDVVRNAFACGYLDEPSAWRHLAAVVPPATRRYDSWRRFAEDYLLGRVVWTGTLQGTPDEDFPAPQVEADEHIQRLLYPPNHESPWNRVPWQAIHHPDQPRPHH